MLQIDPVIFFYREEILSREEMEMLTAYREADSRAKKDAITMLSEHKVQKKESLAI